MKILLLCDRFPYPLEQGQNLRVFNFARYLPGENEIHLVCYGPAPAGAESQTVFDNVVYFNKPEYKSANSFVLKVLRFLSFDTIVPPNQKLTAYIKEQIESGIFDLVWAYSAMMPYLPQNARLPVIADLIDDGPLEFWRELKISRTFKNFLHNLRYFIINVRFEKQYFSRRYVEAAFITSEIDAQAFRRICPSTPIEVIQNGVDADFYHPMGTDIDKNMIVFEGNMQFAPNVDGVVYFCNVIFPIIKKRLPDLKFYIVGKDPADEVSQLISDDVIVTGFVEDIRPYVAKSAVFVCPLRKGGGIKNKILQAWSMGKACVVTSVCVGGLQAVDGVNVIIRDDVEEIADAVVMLINDARMRQSMGGAARRTIEQKYTWQINARKLTELMWQAQQSKRAY